MARWKLVYLDTSSGESIGPACSRQLARRFLMADERRYTRYNFPKASARVAPELLASLEPDVETRDGEARLAEWSVAPKPLSAVFPG